MTSDPSEASLAQSATAEGAKREFLANISHELRTPMNGILGFAHLMRETELKPEQREYLKHIEQCGQQLLLLINDLIDYAHLESGRFELAQQRFSLAETLRRACEPWLERAHAKGLGFGFSLEPGLPAELVGDVERLSQILRHCLDNAVKFTHQGEIRVEVQAAQRDAETLLLQISVHDTGIGLGPEAIGRLFSGFEQGDGSTSRDYGGTGMGLAVARTLAQSMGGSVGVDSQPGQGSRFWFQVRLALPPAPAKLLLAPTPAAPEQTSQPRAVTADERRFALAHCQALALLVEDSDAAARERFLDCEPILRAVAPEISAPLRHDFDAFDFDAAQQKLEQLKSLLN